MQISKEALDLKYQLQELCKVQNLCICVFFIALYVLNLLLIRPIREIIRKRKAVMDDMSGESESYEYQAEQRLSDYDNQLTRARQDAGQNREKAREAGAAEQASLVAEAQKRAQEIIAETRRNLQAEADASLKELRGQVATLSGQLAERVLRG